MQQHTSCLYDYHQSRPKLSTIDNIHEAEGYPISPSQLHYMYKVGSALSLESLPSVQCDCSNNLS
jgi:hypothetical protein